MEPGFKPKWTKEDSRLCVEFFAFFVGCGAIWGLLSGEGLGNGMVAGLGLWGLITVCALVYVGFLALKR